MPLKTCVTESNHVILVTGANGYIGLHLLARAFDQRHRIRAIVRSESAATKLRLAFTKFSQYLTIYLLEDVRNPQNYCDALEGVTEVIHAASPFNISPCHNVKDVLAPAMEISMALLEAVRCYGDKVRHIVSISSFAAIVDVSQGLRAGYTYSEKDWNPMTYEEAAISSNGVAVYCASKGLAEAEMWRWMSQHINDVSFTLSAINPPWVFGPSYIPLSETTLSASLEKLRELLNAASVPPTDIAAFVDVRDVAVAAIQIIEMVEPPAQRFLLGKHFDWQTAVDIIRDAFPSLRDQIPVGNPGYGHQEPVYSLCTNEVEKSLGIKFTPLETTLQDTIQQFLSMD